MSLNLSFTTGDQTAFAKVFDHFYDHLCGFANCILKDEYTAQDVVADVFIKLWEKGGQFTCTYSLKGWLFITTRNACYNLRKRSKPEATTDEYLNIEADWNREQQIIRAEQIKAVLCMADSLPPKCKVIFNLSFFYGFSNAQIAALCGISVSTVKNQRARGIQLLRKKLLPML
jgi:RNA polymerase sigma-70 factor (family 1)